MTGRVCATMLLAMCLTALAQDGGNLSDSISGYRERMLEDRAGWSQPVAVEFVAQAADGAGQERSSLVVAPAVDSQPAPGVLLAEMPDPSRAEEIFAARYAALEADEPERRVLVNYAAVIEKARAILRGLTRPQQLQLSLQECIERTLRNNYTIQIQAINPAVSQAAIVQAEAAFDAVFFLDGSYATRDEPTASDLSPTGTDARSISGGFRKLLPSGMRTSVSLGIDRQFIENFQFQQLNPAYSSVFRAEFSQPLLRGFGLDYNRSGIMLRQLDRDIAQERFLQSVRETLLNTERAYWGLARARREVLIQAETVGQNHVTYETLLERQFDATQVEIKFALSRLRQREVQFQQAVRAARDAEDALKNLMNDPDIKLSRTIELIPTDEPFVAPLIIDQFAEVRTAIDMREEVRQARMRIEQSRIRTNVAKNETLPELDLTFSYEVRGLGSSGDNSFDNLTTARFQSYAVGVTLSYPLGNRAAEAGLRQAELREKQEVVGYWQAADTVTTEVNNAVRAVIVGYETIPTQFQSVEAALLNLRALQARAREISPTYLETELNTIDQLNSTRSTLLGLITDYNTSIVELESAKGTLLPYYNIVVADDFRARRQR